MIISDKRKCSVINYLQIPKIYTAQARVLIKRGAKSANLVKLINSDKKSNTKGTKGPKKGIKARIEDKKQQMNEGMSQL